MRLRKLGINGIPKKDQLAQIKKINIWKWLFLGLVSSGPCGTKPIGNT